MHRPKEVHLYLAHKVLQYLKELSGKEIMFRKNDSVQNLRSTNMIKNPIYNDAEPKIKICNSKPHI